MQIQIFHSLLKTISLFLLLILSINLSFSNVKSYSLSKINAGFNILFTDRNSIKLPFVRGDCALAPTLFTMVSPQNLSDFSNIKTLSTTAILDDFNGDGILDKICRSWYYQPNSGLNKAILILYKDGMSGKISRLYNDLDFRDWSPVLAGDLDGDKKDDLLFRHDQTGDNVVWYNISSIDSQIRGEILTTVQDQNWEMIDMADITGDKKAEILWQNKSSNEIAIWTYRNRELEGFFVNKLPEYWKLEGLGDSNNDTRSEKILKNSSNELIAWELDSENLGKLNKEVVIVNLESLAKSISNVSTKKGSSYQYSGITNKF